MPFPSPSLYPGGGLYPTGPATFGDDYAQALAPWTKRSDDLTLLAEAIGSMFDPVADLVYETGSRDDPLWLPGWGKLFDVGRCPAYALGYLAQYVGVQVPPGTPAVEARQLIRAEQAKHRGTVAAILSAVMRGLRVNWLHATVACAGSVGLPAYVASGVGPDHVLEGLANGELLVDGYLPQPSQASPLADRVLVTNAVNPTDNGLYIVVDPGGTDHQWLLRRAPEVSVPSQFPSTTTIVSWGTALMETAWDFVGGGPISLDGQPQPTTTAPSQCATVGPLPASTFYPQYAMVGSPQFNEDFARWQEESHAWNSWAFGDNALLANANGALVIDGYSVAPTDRVLVKDEVYPALNGLYVCLSAGDGTHPWVLRRSIEPLRELTLLVEHGTANAGSTWALTNPPQSLEAFDYSFTGTVTAGSPSITGVSVILGPIERAAALDPEWQLMVLPGSFDLAFSLVHEVSDEHLTVSSNAALTGTGTFYVSPALVFERVLTTPTALAYTEVTPKPYARLVERTDLAGRRDAYAFVIGLHPEDIDFGPTWQTVVGTWNEQLYSWSRYNTLFWIKHFVEQVKPAGVLPNYLIGDGWNWLESTNEWEAEQVSWGSTWFAEP